MKSFAAIVLLLTLSQHTRAEPALREPAPATSTTQDAQDQEADRILETLIPADVREGKREPTDAQALLLQFAMLTMLNARTNPVYTEQNEKNRQASRQQIEALRKAHEESKQKYADQPADIRDTFERSMTAAIEAVKVASTITDAAATKGATDAQVEQRAREQLRALPQRVREFVTLTTDANYYSHKLELLENRASLTRLANESQDESERQNLTQRIEATTDLLAALDQRYQAQKRLLSLTPIGQYNDFQLRQKK